MTKNELVQALQNIEGDPTVVVYNADDSVYNEVKAAHLVALRAVPDGSIPAGKEWVWQGILEHPKRFAEEIVLSIT